jgi:uncharacterized membrane protein YkoI
MKTTQTTLAVITLAAFASIAAAGEEKELSAKQVPQAVHEAFQKAYPGAKSPKFSQEVSDGKTTYEVEFKEQGKEIEATFSAEGTLLETEQEIKISELPKEIVAAIEKAHPGAKLKEAEKLLKADGSLSGFEVEIKVGKQELELTLDPSGTILKTEAEKSDKD